jgi:hypothetical protein
MGSVTRTSVPLARQQLLLAALRLNGCSVQRVAFRLGVPEALLQTEIEALEQLGLVDLRTSFYGGSAAPEGGVVRITAEGELAMASLEKSREVQAYRLRLMHEYPEPGAARAAATQELGADLKDALLFMTAVEDAGVIGTIQTWVGQELRSRTPGLNGAARG